ncbi:hypothetical protein Francci3_0299 [Frankia casuarinae]|uniref:DNA-binding protein n=2 Tax=Frankiaceae TaxID=74712 RepID=Q2JGA6_FRACC|nr:hypothetical protein Francci3_0299 [Frankia casuarinae]
MAPRDSLQEPSLWALRKTLMPSSDSLNSAPASEPPALDEIGKTLARAGRAYNSSRYQLAATELPGILDAAQVAVSHYDGDDELTALRYLAQAYRLAGAVLIYLRHEDLGYWSVMKAKETSSRAGSEILDATATGVLSWYLLRQRRFDEAEEIAVRAAENIEPSMTKATPQHLSVWGTLLLRGSSAASRNNRPDTSHELIQLARMAAVRVETDRIDYGPHAWISFGPTVVETASVENTLIGGDPSLALHLARSVRPSKKMSSGRWSRHLLTVAEAQVSTHNYPGATRTLVSIRKSAPEWLRNQRTAHSLVGTLLDATGVRTAKSSGLSEMADFMDLRP